jgi:DNA-binding transcriptional ArsR family regulator
VGGEDPLSAALHPTPPSAGERHGAVSRLTETAAIAGAGSQAHATTSDVFNAIAEPRRRRILPLLKGSQRPVNDVAHALGITASRASKHLRVLRAVGLVHVRGAGQQRLYALDARGLKPVYDWVGGFEQFWSESCDRLDQDVQEY